MLPNVYVVQMFIKQLSHLGLSGVSGIYTSEQFLREWMQNVSAANLSVPSMFWQLAFQVNIGFSKGIFHYDCSSLLF